MAAPVPPGLLGSHLRLRSSSAPAETASVDPRGSFTFKRLSHAPRSIDAAVTASPDRPPFPPRPPFLMATGPNLLTSSSCTLNSGLE
jgi:hypothetical protein